MENIGSQPIVTPTVKTKVELIMTTRGHKVLVRNNGIPPQRKSRYLREPWLTTSIKTSGTIRVQCGNKSEMINIQRVKPFDDVTNI